MISVLSLVHACVATVAALAGEMTSICDINIFSEDLLATYVLSNLA